MAFLLIWAINLWLLIVLESANWLFIYLWDINKLIKIKVIIIILKKKNENDQNQRKIYVVMIKYHDQIDIGYVCNHDQLDKD